jgi:SPP1 gp7 family putative phage head morphogenesis protein
LTYNSTNEARQKAVRELFERLKVKEMYKRAYTSMKFHGYCLIVLGWVEGNPDDPTKEPTNISGIDFLHVIPKTRVKAIWQERDPLKENYGAIIAYTIERPVKETTEEIKVPASRFIHWRNDFLDDDPAGISMFEPLYDKYTVKKNFDFAMGEVPFSTAKPFPTLTVPDDADDDEVKAADESMEFIDVKSHFTLPKSYALEFQGPTSVLNPKPYGDYLLQTLAAGSLGSKVALLGTEAGSVTGSEVNVGEWKDSVKDEQTNVIQPKLQELLKLLTLNKIIPEGDDEFDWAPLWELDDNEQADVASKKSTAAMNLGAALQALGGIGFKAYTKDKELRFIDKNGAVIAVPAISDLVTVLEDGKAPEFKEPAPAAPPAPGAQPGAPSEPPGQQGTPPGPPAPPAPQKAGQAAAIAPQEARRPPLSDAVHAKLYGKWYEKTEALEGSFSDAWRNLVTVMEAQMLAALKKSWERHVGEVGHEPPPPVPGKAAAPGANENTATPDLSAVLKDLSAWEAKGWSSFDKAFEAFVKAAVAAGADQTALNLGDQIDPTILEDSASIKLILANLETLGKNTYLDTHKAALQELAEGLKKGESYAQLTDRLAAKFTEFGKGIPATVQKVVHEAASEARWETMKELGVKKGVYTTAQDELVRPEHAALEGLVMTRDEAMPYLSDYGCRCTIVPLTAYDELVAEIEAGEGEWGGLE